MLWIRISLLYIMAAGLVGTILLVKYRDLSDHQEYLPLLLAASFLVTGELLRVFVRAVGRSTEPYIPILCGGIGLSLVMGAAIRIATDFSFTHTTSVIWILFLVAGLLAYIASMVMLTSNRSNRPNPPTS